MKKTGFSWVFVCFLIFQLSESFGQQVIQGTIADAQTGLAISNAYVIIQGTNSGTASDHNGNFSVKLPQGCDQLIFRAIGYKSKTIALNGRKELSVQMMVDQIRLDETVITATRLVQTKFSSARVLSLADEKDITNKNTLSVLDVFRDKIGIWVEKRTTTTSDPVIRGLSGANLLALINGNSFSTLWGEGGFAGDDMYGKVDPESMQRIEVVRGPASVIYGSNALGGVINFIPKSSPVDFTDQNYKTGGMIRGAYGSSSNYLMGRFETWGASQNVKYFAGVTTHHSGDLRAGGDVGVISPSGGKDFTADMNTSVKLNSKNVLTFSGQYMNRPEVYRFYRPSQLNKNLRWGLNLVFRSNHKTRVYDQLKISVYHQYKKDTRIWFTDESRKIEETRGYAWWRTIHGDAHAIKYTGEKGRLVYGLAYQLDIAESPGDEQFTMKTPSGEQAASPKTWWHNPGFYSHYECKFKQWITLSAGIRSDYFYFKSGDETFYTKPGDPDTTKNKQLTNPDQYTKQALTGSLAGVFHVNESTNIALTYSRGFRMFPPHFGFSQTGQGVLVPNGLLKPITADMFEISPRLQLDAMDVFVSGYYTRFNNFQQPIHGTYNGQEYIDYNNNGTYEPDERVYINTPNGEANVTGIEIELSLNLYELTQKLKGIYLLGGYMYNYGRMKFPDEEEMPLRHTHPERFIFSLRYEKQLLERSFWAEFTGDIIGKFDQVAPGRLMSDVGYLDNPQDPGSGLYCEYGLPGYEVFHFYSGLYLSNSVYLTLAIENIFDIRYRTAHSRMDASGRNFLIGLDYTF